MTVSASKHPTPNGDHAQAIDDAGSWLSAANAGSGKATPSRDWITGDIFSGDLA